MDVNPGGGVGNKQGPLVTGAVPGVELSGGLIKLLNRLITELKSKRAMNHGPRMTQGHPSGSPHQALYGSCPGSHQRHSGVSHTRETQVHLCRPSVGLHAGPSAFFHMHKPRLSRGWAPGVKQGAADGGTNSPLSASRGPGTHKVWSSARLQRRPAHWRPQSNSLRSPVSGLWSLSTPALL